MSSKTLVIQMCIKSKDDDLVVGGDDVGGVGNSIEYYKYLSETVMQNTRGARFTASHLLVLKERASLMILSALTIFLIGFSILLLAAPHEISAEDARNIGVLSVVASVSVLAITLFDYALGRGLLASKLHDSALRITELMRGIERELAKDNPSVTVLEALAERYETENKLTNVNHSHSDVTLSKLMRMNPSCIGWKIPIVLFRNFYKLYLVVLSVVPGLVVISCVIVYAMRVML